MESPPCRGLRRRCICARSSGYFRAPFPRSWSALPRSFPSSAARGNDLLTAGELGGLAENQRASRRVELVERVSNGWIGAAARCRIGLAAFRRYPQIRKPALLPLLFARPLQVLARRLGRAHDRVVVAVQLDAEAGDRLARHRDRVDDL